MNLDVPLEALHIIKYPDPRLKQTAAPVERFDAELAAFVQRMIELMHAGRGVGLAAPQVGVLRRIFVANPTGEPSDNVVFINPELHDLTGSAEAEEGCLSIPQVYVQVKRATQCTIRAQHPDGTPFELKLEDFIARICQHEHDHLNGTLILDRMGPSDRIATKKRLKELEVEFAARQRHTTH